MRGSRASASLSAEKIRQPPLGVARGKGVAVPLKTGEKVVEKMAILSRLEMQNLLTLQGVRRISNNFVAIRGIVAPAAQAACCDREF